MLAPAFANASAMAWPMLESEPVMRAILLSRFAIAAPGLRGRRSQFDFQPAGTPSVERLISLDHARQWLDFGEDFRRIDFAGRNQLKEMPNVFAVMTVPHLHGQVFVHSLADRENPSGSADRRQ